MCRVYAQAGDKVLQGIHALLNYREEQLKQPSGSNLPVTKICLPIDAQERERENQVLDYEELLSRHVESETRTHKLISKNKGYANPDSCCSLVELCAAEIKSGTRINDVFLADLLMKKPGQFVGIPVKVEAKNDNDINDHLVNSIEDYVIRGWLQQIKKMRNQ